MNNRHCLPGLLLALGAWLPLSAWAQEAAAPPPAAASSALTDALIKAHNTQAISEMLKAMTVEMPVTTSPATFVLGAASTVVPRVSTFREFATEISNGVGQDGKIARSVAAEINPLLSLGPVSWRDYQASTMTRVLTRTTLSFATLAGESGNAAKAAFGVQSVLYSAEAQQAIDEAGRGNCAAIAKAFLSSDLPKKIIVGELVPMVQVADEAKEACKQKVQGLLTKWNPTSVSVGFGQALQSDSGKATGLSRASTMAWLTGTLGIDGGSAETAVEQRFGAGLTAHLRRSVNERIADPADATASLNENATLAGLNLRLGNRKLAGLFEASLRHGRSPGMDIEKRKRYVIGLEYRINKDLYLVAAGGGDAGRRDGKSDRIGLMNLKWGFSPETLLDPR